jgi:hypothetical protein
MSLSKIISIPNNEKYTLHIFEEESNQPKVWSVRGNKYVKPRTCSQGKYLRINLGSPKNCYMMHKLVATCCIPNPANLPVLDHINRNKLDNRPENLRWVSYSDNAKNIGPAVTNSSTQTD